MPDSPPPGDAPRTGEPARPGRSGPVKAVLAVTGMALVVAVASVGTIMAMSGGGKPPASQPAASVKASSRPAAKAPAVPAGTAAWVVSQVSPATAISCDQAMCAALQAHGYPAKNLRPLGSEARLKGSGVVVVTPAALQLFGSSLVTAWAPDALATFGSGSSAVSVRIVARQGAPAYEQAARRDQAVRASSEAALTQASSITIGKPAAQDLKSGRVDGRLMEAITAAATAEPIHILDFGNAGTGASAGVPLRYADLAASDSAAGMSASAYVQSLRAGMNAGTGSRPDRIELLTLPGGHQVLRVEFLAPSPFGVLSNP